MPNFRIIRKASLNVLLLLLSLTLFLLPGCVTTPAPEEPDEAVFFPDPPAPPRVQFLRSFTTADDITEATSSFDTFLTGEQNKAYHLIKPYGVAIKDGKLYVCDSQVNLFVFDLKDKKFYSMQGAKGLGKVVQPLNITIDEQGNKFVADPVRGEVLMYDSKDFFVKSFGLAGQWKPVDTAIADGQLYVVDSQEREIKVFDIESSEKIRTFGRNNKPEENLGLPTGIAMGPDKLLHISDSGRFQVVVYDRDGHQRTAIGRPGANLGHFARPRGVAVDKESRIYAVDAAFENVQVFRKDGQLLFFFGGSGREPGKLFLPAAVTIDYDNIDYFRQYADPDFDIEHLIIVTSQFGERLVNVYGFGKQRGRSYLSEDELIKKAEDKLKKWQKDSE